MAPEVALAVVAVLSDQELVVIAPAAVVAKDDNSCLQHLAHVHTL